MAHKFLRLGWFLAAMAVLPVSAAEQPYFDSPQALQKLEDEERRLWSQSVDLQGALEKGGQVYQQPELERYLQGVMDKLYPELAGHIKVRIIRSPMLNAFAIPNGAVYVNTGMLARFNNEAQLAAVLAHEGAHFVYRHGYRQQQTTKGASAFAVATQLLGVPIVGLLGNVIATSSMFGFSRELETEADNMGFDHLVKAGYDVSQAAKVFEHLAKEVELSETKETFFYSTHPKLKDRIANYVNLARKHQPGGELGVDEYSRQVALLRMEDLESELSFGRFKHIIALLKDEEVRSRYAPAFYYYLGEAHRKRNEAGDIALAERYYEQALARAPDLALTYRAKGLLALQQDKYEEAGKLLARYLELAPQASDRSYIENYLETIQLKNKENS